MYVLENWSNWLRVYASRQGFGQRGVLQQATGFGQYPPAPGDVLNVQHTMGCCGKRNLLMIMTSVCACASFASLVIAVATDYWLYMSEKIANNTEGTSFYLLKTTAGLWKKCEERADSPIKNCTFIDYFTPKDRDGLGPTEAILLSMRRSTVFPLISLLILTAGVITCFLGHCNNTRKVVSVVAGILYVIGGLVCLIGIILYIGAITEEVGGQSKDPKFKYEYGSSFMLTIGSFIGSELTGVFSVYLYISRHKHAYRKKQQERLTMLVDTNERPHPSRYRRPHSRSQSRDHSRENSPSHSDTYYTYTPVSDTSKEMSNYTLQRDPSRHTISTTADTHTMSKEHSLHSVREMDTFRRTTPV